MTELPKSARPVERITEDIELKPKSAVPIGASHAFVGRHDRDCEVCGYPDRFTIHIAEQPKSAAADKPQADHHASKGPTEAADTHSTAGRPESAPAASLSGQGDAPAVESPFKYITAKQQNEFHAACRMVFATDDPKRNKSDNWAYQWLMDNHYLNPKGEPSAAAIPTKDWPQARDMAARWVRVQS